MKRKNYLFLLPLFLFFSVGSYAQIEKVFVETYYVSDGLDAADSINGNGVLEVGSKTYRVYIDLAPGSQLLKIYGDANHALKFSSSSVFFNNITDGQTFANDISKSRLGENTVALDTWLTLGVTTKSVSKVFGIPKKDDSDGSFVGGSNNDYGLLANTDPLAGIPLTTSDGNQTVATAASGWGSSGFSLTNDTSIFGSVVPGTQFVCNNCGLQNSGVSGVDPDSNFVLVAQLTTKGDLEFELNVEVQNALGAIIKYVANDSILLVDEVLDRNLKYPFAQICGCPDSNYVEYLADRDCNNQDDCQHLVVFGCMDPNACNYDPTANINIQALCCYPGKCSDREIAFVCPELATERKSSLDFSLYPNPAKNILNIQTANQDNISKYVIYNSLGQKLIEQLVDNATALKIDLSTMEKGIFMLRIFNGNESTGKLFVKE